MKKFYAALLAAAMLTAGAGITAQADDYSAGGGSTPTNGEAANRVAIGNSSKAYGDQSIAIGNWAEAGQNVNETITGGKNATALGAYSKAYGNDSTAIGKGSQATATNSTALGDTAKATGENSTAVGFGSTASGEKNTVIGASSHVADGVTNAAAIGYNSVADESNAVSVGGGAAGNRKVTHVAAGTLSNTSTDAVNGQQLYWANNKIGLTEDGSYQTLYVSNEDGTDHATSLIEAANLNNEMIHENSNRISALSNKVSDLGGEIDSVGAISSALAGLHPLDYDGTGSKFQLAAAMGNYDGTQAAAIGGFYHFNEDVMMSLGGATSFGGNNKSAFNVGVTFRVGEGGHKAVPADVQERLDAQEAEIAALKAQVEALLAKDAQ